LNEILRGFEDPKISTFSSPLKNKVFGGALKLKNAKISPNNSFAIC
jgi:hypothetical protein